MTQRYKRWDYWLSTIIMWALMYVLTAEIMYAWKHGADCFTRREVMAGLAIFAATFILDFAAVGWNITVVEKYQRMEK